MYQRCARAVLAATLVLTACDRTAAPVPKQTGTSINSGSIGNVTFTYDARLLVPADVQIPIPPDESQLAFGTKLLPSRDLANDDDRLCGDPADGTEHACEVSEEPGLTFALLEQPFATYAQAFRVYQGEAVRETEIDGANGLFIDAGNKGGLDVFYTLIPVGTRALLIKRQNDGETPPEEAAIAAVMASIDLPE